MTTADQNKQKLIDWLLAYAKKRDIMVELGEVDSRQYITFTEQSSEESPADIFSIKLIYNYSCKMGDCFEDQGLFMQAYEIPNRVADATKEIFKRAA